MISIHALREEGDHQSRVQPPENHDFYPRPPRGGRLSSTLPSPQRSAISIHALREEGDGACLHAPALCCYFYPRPPRGGRPTIIFLFSQIWEFLSTPSARRATAKTEKKSLLLFHYKSFCTKWKELQLCRTRKVRILWQKHPFFRCEENGKSMSACASHTEKSEDQRAVLLETGVKADVLDL